MEGYLALCSEMIDAIWRGTKPYVFLQAGVGGLASAAGKHRSAQSVG